MVNDLGCPYESSMLTFEIAELTGKRHDNVMRDARKILIELYDNSGLLNFEERYKAADGNLHPCYRLPKKEVLVLVSGYSIRLRMKIITRLEELEKKTRDPMAALNDPATMRQILLGYTERVLALESENKKMQPKALFADAVSASTSSILVGELAKIMRQNGIHTGQNRFFAWLRDNGYLIKRKGTDFNMPTQKSMELGLFEIKERTIVNPDESTRITKTSKVTGKGQQYFINAFMGRDTDALSVV
ncbi:hypothetical protein DO021_03000 [Desulfobacter hydrogenophilus]|uniref:Antirepressor protein C-terminal domain-containing protein n=2 Tax=Desulfobacter hydrogenophilus TaxID=2291 RepID=A0A328FKL4_9BACT|nr:hypothetical protein [Desulfobacter hydrogenophilus]QBH15508.1 hypothetical protein EYB58_04120 [Desulfobacter hydrogenophilus]RAM03547.1 hypothetical protein DO021_03000 [Desulfobacter hydrogenophilus]